jgi:hypothetical protein
MEVNSSRPKSLLFQGGLAERRLAERQFLRSEVGGGREIRTLGTYSRLQDIAARSDRVETLIGQCAQDASQTTDCIPQSPSEAAFAPSMSTSRCSPTALVLLMAPTLSSCFTEGGGGYLETVGASKRGPPGPSPQTGVNELALTMWVTKTDVPADPYGTGRPSLADLS